MKPGLHRANTDRQVDLMGFKRKLLLPSDTCTKRIRQHQFRWTVVDLLPSAWQYHIESRTGVALDEVMVSCLTKTVSIGLMVTTALRNTFERILRRDNIIVLINFKP